MHRLLYIFLLLQLFLNSSYAQQLVVKGKVIAGDSNEAIAGANVRVRGTKLVTQTNSSGEFLLQVSDGAQLEFSYLGYLSQLHKVNASIAYLEIKLYKSEEFLKEVVITTYTRESKRYFTGAAAMVTAAKINQVPVGSFEHALQGQAAGAYVTAGSGQPGAPARMVVRGVNTISGVTNPLYVVDNVPLEQNININYGLNPSDIENVTLLKDAATTALYGSRGSNGIVFVTTKKGLPGELKFNYKSQFGLSNSSTGKYSMMTTAQRLQFEEEVGLETTDTWSGQAVPGWNLSDRNPANVNISEVQKLRNAQILDSLRGINTNWLDVFFRAGKFREHDISASGGNDKVRFYSSANYYDQDGIGLRSYLKRYSFRNNLDFTTDKLSGSINLGLSYGRTSVIENENTNSSNNSFGASYFALPYEQPYIDGVLYHTENANTAPNFIYDKREGSTALERLLDATNNNDLLKGIISGNFQYKILKGLSATSLLGLDFRDLNQVRTVLAGTAYGLTVTPGNSGIYREESTRNLQYITNFGLNYVNPATKDHHFEVKALAEINRGKFKNILSQGFGINPKLNNTPASIANGSATPSSITGSRSQTGMISLIGIAKYTFKRLYTITSNYRYDGTSFVGINNRWTGYYSAGANWNVKGEKFLADLQLINGFNIRGSYGKSASPFNPQQPFNYFSTYESTKYNGAQGIVASSPGNANYDWENTFQLNIGTDISLLNNAINLSVDWYNKKTTNIFTNQPLSATSGFPSIQINDGKMRNRGIDINISADVIREKDWQLNFGANFNYNKNQVLDLGKLNEFTVGTTIVRKGLPFGTQYTVKWAGVDPETGDALYYNRDGSITSNYDSANQSVDVKGTFIPPFVGGFNSTLRYKNMSVNALFSFVAEYYRFNNEPLYNESPSFATSNKSTTLLRRWRKPGDITDIQRYDKNSIRRLSSKDVEDASYLKLRNLRINYSLPQQLISQLKIKGAQLYLQGQNLYTWTKWTGFDPEDNNNISLFEYPTSRTYTMGVNVNF